MKGIRISLVCAGGISTSIMCRAISSAASKQGYENVECHAYSIDKLDEIAMDSDVILVGPQISYRYDQIKKDYSFVPVELMSMSDYGSMNGEKIFKNLIEKYI